MSKDAIIFDIKDLAEVVKKVMAKLKNCNIITFTGPLGAGKTTFIREILHNYGIQEDIVSPTFTYMNVYKNKDGKTFFHFDLYRIKSVDEFLMAGFDEYLLVPNSICLIEWPEIIESLLKLKSSQTCSVSIDYEDENKRIIKF